MGEYAEQHIENYVRGRWGMSMPKQHEYPKTTKAAIADRVFNIVEVMVSSKTNRLPGTKLVVCDNTDELYWVWASKEVTSIRKDVCKMLDANLSLAEALVRAGRKPYGAQKRD